MRIFPQLDWQTELASRWPGKVIDAGTVSHGKREFPLTGFSLGSSDPKAPVFGLVGGVHGIEIIGTEVVLAFMTGIAARYAWDETLREQLTRSRWIFWPIANPVGMSIGRRSNGNGVDLMRNAPIESPHASFMLGGQRISRHLPWYRGELGAPPEKEILSLADFVRAETRSSERAVVIDCHSGFGAKDRLWFPYARALEPYPSAPEMAQLKKTMDLALPHHVYALEPQALSYRTHGDLWDFLYDERRAAPDFRPEAFLPLTLEMGSMLWVRKNPFQIFTYSEWFNPIKPHRRRRILRRHLPFFDFLGRLIVSPKAWVGRREGSRRDLAALAQSLWYAA